MIDKTVIVTLLFDVFNTKLNQLSTLKHEAKRFYNDVIKRNQKLINLTNTALKERDKIDKSMDLLQLYDDFSIILYNVVDKLETLETEDLKEYINYLNNWKENETT